MQFESPKNEIATRFQDIDSRHVEEINKLPPKERKEAYRLWIQQCTTRIVPKIFHQEYLLMRTFWVLFLIFSSCISFYITVKYLRNYLSYNTIISIDYLYESPTFFPSATICNLNPFYKPRADAYIKAVLDFHNLTNATIGDSMSAFNLTSTQLELIRAAIASDVGLSEDERKKLGFGLEEMLVSCSFNGLPCTSHNFSYLPSYEYGNCYTFNSGTDAKGNQISIKQISTVGHRNALELELYIGNTSLDEELMYKNGVHLIVHNQTYAPIIGSEGISIPNGFETSIGIRRTFIARLGSPYSNCKTDLTPDFNSRLVRAIFSQLNYTSYKQKFCYQLCYQEKIVHDCNCSDPSLPYKFDFFYKAIRPCFNKSEIQCLIQSKSQFLNSPISEDCAAQCPLECFNILYDYKLNMATYPTYSYAKRLMKQSAFFKNVSSIEQIRNRMLKVNIFYEEMFYESIKERPALTWDILLGNIGGMLSLFIGVTVLTIGDLVELAYLAIMSANY